MFTHGARRARTTVSIHATETRTPLIRALKDAIDLQLDGEWAMSIEDAQLVAHNDESGADVVDVVFVAIPGAGPADSTEPVNLPAYQQTRGRRDFDRPAAGDGNAQ